ncbi:MAG: M20/M25/M40 family metallo-hydrolase [Anaerovoracaceae bacterium]|jgi:acetylornithine deacetylase/succinyl-diaminopimelate desuccinylase-like protein
MDKIFEIIDTSMEAGLKDLREFCSFRSVYEDAEGLQSAQKFIQEKLEELDIPYVTYNSGRPSDVILAKKILPGKPTLLIYNHYDVVDVEEESQDSHKQNLYDMTEVDGRLFARGVSDNKGALLARLQALSAIQQARDDWPVGIALIYDNCEESGSETLKHMRKNSPELFREYTDADLCLWENGRTLPDQSPEAAFGVRASLYVTLTARSSNGNEHARMGAELPNAAFRLIQAIASMKDAQENILIEGFYEDVLEVTQADVDIIKKYPYNEKEMMRNKGIKEFLLGLSGTDLKKRIFLSPLLNVNGISSGCYGDRFENIVPSEAVARLSIALVPLQTGDDILRKLKAHLFRHGFDDIEVIGTPDGFPIRTDINSRWRDLLAAAAKDVYEKPLTISVTQLGGGPGYIFREISPNLPIIAACGVAALDSGHHSAGENILIDNYLNGAKFTAATIMKMAQCDE